MISNAAIAELAGQPNCAAMLRELTNGRALTASELARVARIKPQLAKDQLERMMAAGLLKVVMQGPHRYHRLAAPKIASVLKKILQVATDPPLEQPRIVTGPRDPSMRTARTCYHHIAGNLGVGIADALVAGGHIELNDEAGLLTNSGVELFGRIGIDVDALAARGKAPSARVFCRPCLDWSERRWHLAGALGTAICAHSFAKNWIRRIADSRTIAITPKGQKMFREEMGVILG